MYQDENKHCRDRGLGGVTNWKVFCWSTFTGPTGQMSFQETGATPNVLHELGSACTQMKRYFAGFVSVFHDVATAMHFRSEMTSAADHDWAQCWCVDAFLSISQCTKKARLPKQTPNRPLRTSLAYYVLPPGLISKSTCRVEIVASGLVLTDFIPPIVAHRESGWAKSLSRST